VTRFYMQTCQWCRRVAAVITATGLLLLGRTLILFARQEPQPVKDQSQLWAQLVTAGLVIGVGVWAIKTFLAFKDEAVRQAAEDRIAAVSKAEEVRTVAITKAEEVKAALAAQIALQTREMQDLHYAIMGVQGRGGLLADSATDQRRRHDLGNHVLGLTAVLVEVVQTQGIICQKLGIPYDGSIADDIKATVRKP